MFSSGRGLRNAGWTLTAVFCFAANSFAQNPMMAVDKNLPLSAEQTAHAIGILPLFARIKKLTAFPAGSSTAELAVLQQQVLMRVTAASLQIEAATGEIDSEIADIHSRKLQGCSHSCWYCRTARADFMLSRLRKPAWAIAPSQIMHCFPIAGRPPW
jgi:hypothetical protein